MKVFNKVEKDFSSLREYNDYLEEVEDLSEFQEFVCFSSISTSTTTTTKSSRRTDALGCHGNVVWVSHVASFFLSFLF
jgi:hypothetical protein